MNQRLAAFFRKLFIFAAPACLAALLSPAAAQCVLTSVPCPPTPPACPVTGCGGSVNRGGGGTVTHDAYYYRIKAYNDLMDQAHNAAANRNYQLQLTLLLQAQQKDNTKEVRSRLSEAYGNIAITRGDAVQALEDFEAAIKTCRSCFNANMTAYMAKLKQYIADQAAAAHNQQAAIAAAAQAKAAAGQNAAAEVAASRAALGHSVASGQNSANSAKLTASDNRTQAILNGSAAQQQAAQQRAAAGPLVASDTFFGKKPANPNDPNSPYHLAPGTQPASPSSKPTDTNAFRSLGAAAGSSSTGAGQAAGSDPSKDIGSETARGTIDTPGSPTSSVAANAPGTPRAEPVLTPAQTAQLNSRLASNSDYQKLLVDHAQAVKDVAKANQSVTDLTAKYSSMPDGPAKQQAAVDLANASQQKSQAQSVLATNEANQQHIKEEEVDIIMLPPAPKKKPAEPPLPSLPPQ